MERAPAARPLACARGAAGRQTTVGGPRRGMAHHCWVSAAPRPRRCPGRPSYPCPVAGGRAGPAVFSSAAPTPRRQPPFTVERAYQAFQRFDWTTPELLALQILFLRAARVVDDRSLDLPMPLRGLIASKLEKSGVPALQTAKIKGFVPIGRSDRASLYDESLPPGLILIE